MKDGLHSACWMYLQGKKIFTDMLLLVCAYVAVIGFVQGARYIKRFYVRRFANDINRGMKQVLYGNLVHKSVGEAGKEGPEAF